MVIPAEAEPAPHLMRGIHHQILVPCFRRDGVWTPAFAGVTVYRDYFAAC